MADLQRDYVPAKTVPSDYPVSLLAQYTCIRPLTMHSSLLIVIRMTPVPRRSFAVLLLTFARHIKRVIRYARPSDYARGAAFSLVPPALMLTWEKFAPSYVGRGGFAPIMRLTAAIGLAGGFLHVYQLSCRKTCN